MHRASACSGSWWQSLSRTSFLLTGLRPYHPTRPSPESKISRRLHRSNGINTRCCDVKNPIALSPFPDGSITSRMFNDTFFLRSGKASKETSCFSIMPACLHAYCALLKKPLVRRFQGNRKDIHSSIIFLDLEESWPFSLSAFTYWTVLHNRSLSFSFLCNHGRVDHIFTGRRPITSITRMQCQTL